jgi:hypothetical protein
MKAMKLLTYLSISIVFVVMMVIGVDGSKSHATTPQTQLSHYVDLIIFSFDRPLQLYALLESVKTYMTGLNCSTVIYRTSSDAYAHAYDQVHKDFQDVRFMCQGKNPREDFKPLVMQTVQQAGDFIIFAVDDIIMTDHVNLAECIEELNKTDAYGFYLRLGTHLTECYTMAQHQKVPELSPVTDTIYQWHFNKSELDWAYPNTVDMAIYRKKDIANAFANLDYFSPNSLEGSWHAYYTKHLLNRTGLCFHHAKMVNLPLNRVHNEWNNRTMNAISTDELLKFFNAGLKINIQQLFRVDNKAAHMEYIPTFTKRVAA